MAIAIDKNGKETTLEYYKNLRSESRTRQNLIKASIQAARNAQINAEHKLVDALASIDLPVEERLKRDIERFVTEGKGNLARIMNEIQVYYEVEVTTRCYRETK